MCRIPTGIDESIHFDTITCAEKCLLDVLFSMVQCPIPIKKLAGACNPQQDFNIYDERISTHLSSYLYTHTIFDVNICGRTETDINILCYEL